MDLLQLAFLQRTCISGQQNIFDEHTSISGPFPNENENTLLFATWTKNIIAAGNIGKSFKSYKTKLYRKCLMTARLLLSTLLLVAVF